MVGFDQVLPNAIQVRVTSDLIVPVAPLPLYVLLKFVTFGDRKERVVRGAPLATNQARSLARAMYLERARRFVCGTGTTDGTPTVRVGGRVSLSGLGAMLDGTYYVSRARHRFDVEEGYRTELDVERAGIGAAQ